MQASLPGIILISGVSLYITLMMFRCLPKVVGIDKTLWVSSEDLSSNSN